jgi:Hypervirulence associated proteins TUDOR domain
MMKFHNGSMVEWEWGKGTGTGKIVHTFTRNVTRTIKGAEVSRKASTDEPAYLIEQENGDKVLKSGSELKAAD